MAKFELKLPKMGESVEEATLTAWLVDIGDQIQIDDGVLEVSTDKVDTELPTEVSGVLIKKLFEIDDVIKVGQTIAIIETSDNVKDFTPTTQPNEIEEKEENNIEKQAISTIENEIKKQVITNQIQSDTNRFYSPLVRSIATKEGISQKELDALEGTGKNKRLTKDDLFTYLKNRKSNKSLSNDIPAIKKQDLPIVKEEKIATVSGDVVIPMDRMGKLIAKHMIDSIQTSAHVQSFIEIDVTNIVNWRKKVKDQFLEEKGEKVTFTPIFLKAIAETIKIYPGVNVSVEGTNIIQKKSINLGMATALSDGNLIVPVIKNADELSLTGMIRAVNSLALKARTGKLTPDEIQGGTYTVSNVGSFGSITGTPIINQPQVAILALGAIRKMPSVIETPDGDFIGIRHKMIVAHSYDHRVVNGALGGLFILKLKEILENFDVNENL